MIIDENEWEKFCGAPSAPFDERIYVTLNHKSQIYLNRHTYEILGSPSHVEMYMHRTRESILIAPTATQTASSFTINEKQVGYIILASPFCRYHHIQTPTTIQFIGLEIDHQKLKLDLTQTINAEISVRRPRSSQRKTRLWRTDWSGEHPCLPAVENRSGVAVSIGLLNVGGHNAEEASA